MSYHQVIVDGVETTTEGNTYNDAVINAAFQLAEQEQEECEMGEDDYEGF